MTILSPVRPDAVEVYLLDYDRPPKAVDGDLALLGLGGGFAVVTSSAFRLTEARRTERGMRGPFASADEALSGAYTVRNAVVGDSREALIAG
jgi:hypothetical protein